MDDGRELVFITSVLDDDSPMSDDNDECVRKYVLDEDTEEFV